MFVAPFVPAKVPVKYPLSPKVSPAIAVVITVLSVLLVTLLYPVVRLLPLSLATICGPLVPVIDPSTKLPKLLEGADAVTQAGVAS